MLVKNNINCIIFKIQLSVLHYEILEPFALWANQDSDKPVYVGHPISSDNGLISQKLLFKSEFFNP